MTRAEKFKDTSTFHFFNINPKGKLTSDCVVRAIATATDIEYKTVVMELAEMQCKLGYDSTDKRLYGKYLESKGWHKNSQPKKLFSNKKYTGEEFCKMLTASRREGAIVANIGGHHVVCIRKFDGEYKVWDTWDSTIGSIGNYWTEGE